MPFSSFSVPHHFHGIHYKLNYTMILLLFSFQHLYHYANYPSYILTFWFFNISSICSTFFLSLSTILFNFISSLPNITYITQFFTVNSSHTTSNILLVFKQMPLILSISLLPLTFNLYQSSSCIPPYIFSPNLLILITNFLFTCTYLFLRSPFTLKYNFTKK